MKFYFFLSVIIIASLPAFSQEVAHSKSTIEVIGIGELSVQPDQTVVNIAATAINAEGGEASKEVTEQINRLVKKLQQVGFKKQAIQVSHFYLAENNRWRNGEMLKDGYRASQHIELTFANDAELLQKVSSTLQKVDDGTTFNFSFTLSDAKRKEIKEEVIRKAIQDAREKASVIARSAGIQLRGIYKIQYGNQTGMPMPMHEMSERMAMQADGASFPAADIKDLTIRDQVQIVWVIE